MKFFQMKNKPYLCVIHVDQKPVDSWFLTLKIMLISAKAVTQQLSYLFLSSISKWLNFNYNHVIQENYLYLVKYYFSIDMVIF